MDYRAFISSALPLSTLPPSLPNELITEILAQKGLSKLDLARCCLVSHRFLEPARRSLYSTIRFECHWAPSAPPTQRSLLLVQTILSSPQLGNYATTLYLDTVSDRREAEGDARQVVEELFRCLPRVNELHADGLTKFRDFIISHASRWTSLEVCCVDVIRNFPADTPFVNLRRIRIIQFDTFGSLPHFYLPPHLVYLNLGYERSLVRWQMSIPKGLSSSLRFLCIHSFDFVGFPRISDLPQLQHLGLKDCPKDQVIFSALGRAVSRCRSLISLTLYGYHDQEYLPLLDYLPDGLVRLNFDQAIPSEIPDSYVPPPSFNSIGMLRFEREMFDDECFEGSLDALQVSCDRKGLKLLYPVHEPSLFDV